ncbi:MAG: sulfate adenylyltransferase [Myxococcales bacterium]|nr:sulfate adenylyltransferase [Myxococcales bacterium]
MTAQNRDAIAPHGGVLIDRIAEGAQRADLAARAPSLPAIQLNIREALDLEMIGIGAFSPLTGFMTRADYRATVDGGRLAGGLPWTVPITLSLKADSPKVAAGQEVALCAPASLGGAILGVISVEDVYDVDKAHECKQVFRTEDAAHPGAAYVHKEMGDLYVGGAVWLTERLAPPFPAFHAEPKVTRARFRDAGWRKIAAFQTRNPIHRAHEYLTKVALEVCDGILIHPLVGYTKEDDIPAAVRMQCYSALLESYYPKDRTILTALPAAMRYAGPREAILHATVRKNYGCTHFIVGRDHAGVGNYYGTYDAQKIFDDYTPEEIGITPLMFEHSFWCKKCEGMASSKSCPHDAASRVALSGTKVRDMLKAGEEPPPEFSRPEVARILIAAMRAG